jgi:hypothetical protein
MATPPQKFIVFNYVTSSIEQIDTAPNFGDPNTQVQTDLSQAYSGSVAGAMSLSSGTVTGPSVSALADPAAQVVSAAQASVAVSAEQSQQIQQCLGGLDAVGQIPSTISSMHSHATNILENGTKVFRAIDLTFRPEQTGSPDRCTSLSDFMGSVQGQYNDTLKSVTGTLGTITSALVSIPQTLIAGFATGVNTLITAIQTQSQELISQAISGMCTLSNNLFGGLGSKVQGLIRGVGEAVTGVQTAIQGEIDRVSAALADVLNNPFRLVVPNVNPCTKEILSNSNADGFELPPNLSSPDQSITFTPAPAATAPRSDIRPRWESPTGWVNSRGYPVNADGSAYQASQRELWRLGVDS